MQPQILRPYQTEALRQVLDAWKGGARSVLLVMPTGGGKTSCFAKLAAQIKHPAIVLVHRRELATQAANRFREFGVEFGYVMAGEQAKPWARVQIASVQTLVRRNAPPAGLVICDEAHLSTAKTWQTILSQYPNARILGVTATPWRLGGKPLIGSYDASVLAATPAQLRELGFLCPYQGFSYLAPDLSKVSTKGGEYDERQSGEAMREPQIVANIVQQWKAHASHLSTVVFAVTVEHSQALTHEFKAAGVRAEHLDGGTPIEQRRAVLRRVESGETQVLCNVGIAVEGLDIPRLKCCVLARPTMSLARAIQMMGRVRRPWQGITARIHDHAFVIGRHGLPDAERDYSLHAKNADPPPLTTCAQCLALYSGRACPACAHENVKEERSEREIVSVPDAEQFEFTSDGGPTLPPEAIMPPVEIRWADVGKVVEGTFERSWEETTQWGPTKRYVVKGRKRSYNFPGTTRLNKLMERVKPGDLIRVTFVNQRQFGTGKMVKEFEVEIDQ